MRISSPQAAVRVPASIALPVLSVGGSQSGLLLARTNVTVIPMAVLTRIANVPMMATIARAIAAKPSGSVARDCFAPLAAVIHKAANAMAFQPSTVAAAMSDWPRPACT